MSTDYTVNGIKKLDGNRIKPTVKGFLKYYDGGLSISKKEKNKNTKGYDYCIKDELSDLYLWVYTDKNDIIYHCCRYGSNWNEPISDLLREYMLFELLDNKTIKYYRVNHNISIRDYLVIHEQDEIFYDLYNNENNRELINNIWGNGYWENYKLSFFEDYLGDIDDEISDEDRVQDLNFHLHNYFGDLDESIWEPILDEIHYTYKNKSYTHREELSRMLERFQ